MDVIIQKKRRKALSVSAAPSQLSQRESQGRLFDSTRKDGTVPDKKQKRSPYVIPTVAQAEWRNPPRWIMNHHKVKLATWEDSSTHCVRSE